MRYSPKPFETLLTRFIARQNKIIERLFSQFAYDAAALIVRANLPEGNEDFYFHDREALSRQVDVLLRGLSNRLTKTIQAGDEWGWELANAKNDNMLGKVLESIGRERVPAAALERWNQKNLPALAAFEKRRIGGMSLSDKVWAYTRGIKGDLELALDLGLGSGTSADNLSRIIRQFLIEPDRLYRRVRDEKGVLRLSKNAKQYHPGQGVYRSSYKNARRLAATETNMAYRTADNERMNQMDWILGFEVHLSNNHTCLNSKGIPEPFYDICDELQGKYPKWFIFVGWHPLCRCYVTTILPDRDEMIKYLAAMDENGHSTYKLTGEVTELPPQFNEWVKENQNRILTADERGKLPYFIKENYKAVMDTVKGVGNYYQPLTDADIKYIAENKIVSENFLRATMNATDDKYIQGWLSQRINERSAFDIDKYVKIYGKKHPEVVELYKEIGILKGKDEVARLRKINELKNICGELSAREIQKWGYAKGLEYIGVEKSYLYADEAVRKVNGKTVTTHAMRKDLILFRSASGKEFAYPVGARKADIIYDVTDAAKFVDGEMPEYLRKNLDRVVFINARNPYDSYWGATYKIPDFKSYATDGGNVTFWKGVTDNPSGVNDALLHEAGHAYDFAHRITKSPEWKEAVLADIKLYEKGDIASAFPTRYAKKAYEGAGVVDEDFAETLSQKVQWDRNYGEKWFERCFPNRYKVLMDIIAKWPKG